MICSYHGQGKGALFSVAIARSFCVLLTLVSICTSFAITSKCEHCSTRRLHGRLGPYYHSCCCTLCDLIIIRFRPRPTMSHLSGPLQVESVTVCVLSVHRAEHVQQMACPSANDHLHFSQADMVCRTPDL